MGGGAEMHIKHVSERLVLRGHEVTVVTTNSKNESDLARGIESSLPSRESLNGVEVVRVPAGIGVSGRTFNVLSTRIPGGYRSLLTLFDASGLELIRRTPRNFKLFWKLCQYNADVVVAWNWFWPPAYYAYLAHRIKSFPLIGVPLFHTAEEWVVGEIYKKMIASCQALISNTEHEKEFISKQVPTARIEVGGVGVDPKNFVHGNGREFRKKYGIGSAPLVGFIGRVAANKGVVNVAEAMRKVWQWNPNVRLVVAGLRSTPVPELDDVLERYTAAQRKAVVFLYNFSEEEKVSLYQAIDVMALPSVSESFGIAYLEAWLSRKPVIGARTGSTACVIQDEVDGLLVQPNDPEKLSEAIIQLLSDPAQRTRMGNRGYEKTTKMYTWDKVVDRIESVCLDVHAIKK